MLKLVALLIVSSAVIHAARTDTSNKFDKREATVFLQRTKRSNKGRSEEFSAANFEWTG